MGLPPSHSMNVDTRNAIAAFTSAQALFLLTIEPILSIVHFHVISNGRRRDMSEGYGSRMLL